MTDREAADPILTERFDDALVYAARLHRGRLRRNDVPYMAHLLETCAMVLEDGGSEDEAIASLLHDTLEHPDDIPVLNEIRRRYGPHVAQIVEECTDHDPAHDRPEWHVRKRAYIASLPERKESHRVALADKLANARELLNDYYRVGDQVWLRFSAGREVLDYMHQLSDAFAGEFKSPMTAELAATVQELERLAASSPDDELADQITDTA